MLTKMLLIIPLSYFLSSKILFLGILTTINQGHIKGEEIFDEWWKKYKNLLNRKPLIGFILVSAIFPLVIVKKMYVTRNEMYLLLKHSINRK